MQQSPAAPSVSGTIRSRRAVLRGAAVLAGSALLAACGGVAVPSATPPAPTSPPTAVPSAPTTAPTVAAIVTPTAMLPNPATPMAPAVAAPTVARNVAPTPVPVATIASAAVAPAAMPTAAASSQGRIPSPAPNVPDAFTAPPAPFRSVAAVPGKGSTISIFKASQQPPPIPRSENLWWQELEKRMGATLEFTLVPLPQFTEKATARIVAGDLTDIMLISPFSVPDQYKAVQGGVFADLTPYLSKDGRAQFPNLAQYPESAWKNSTIRGALYGVPRLGFAFGSPLLYRQDWAEKAGLAKPKNADESLALFRAMTEGDPDGNGKPDTWALGAQGGDWSLAFAQGMYRVPNVWRREANGDLTNAIETEEYKAALAFARRCFVAGVYHPDAATLNRTQATDALIAGKIGGYVDGIAQLNGDIRTRYEARRLNPAANLTALVPPGANGGAGVTYNGSGYGSIAAIPARVAGADGERAKEILRVLDYFSAPFGSDEYTFLTFGIEGTHHTLQPDGTRVLTQRGRAEINELGTVVVSPRVFSYPSDPGDAALLQNAAREIAAVGIDNPALTAFSPTNVMKAAELNRLGTDRVGAIITGRDPLDALDGYVRDWRMRGGDQIRKELRDALM